MYVRAYQVLFNIEYKNIKLPNPESIIRIQRDLQTAMATDQTLLLNTTSSISISINAMNQEDQMDFFVAENLGESAYIDLESLTEEKQGCNWDYIVSEIW